MWLMENKIQYKTWLPGNKVVDRPFYFFIIFVIWIVFLIVCS